MPAGVGEDDSKQKDTKRSIDDALEESGLETEIDKDRPQSVLNINRFAQWQQQVFNLWKPWWN